MTREDVIAATTVALVALLGLVAWALAELPWLLRSLDERYVAALSALSSAAAAFFTLGATFVAAAYVLLTYRLVGETAAHREGELMLRLMEEYDRLRTQIDNVRDWHQESAASGVDAVERFDEAAGNDFVVDDSKLVDESRFKVSRFFVKVRKLSKAGILDEHVITAALSRAAMEDVFLKLIDPLDQVIATRAYGRPNVTDRDFYRALGRKYPRPPKAE